MLKKTCAAAGLTVAAVATALLIGSPAQAGGFGDDGGDRNVNVNEITNSNTSTNTNENTNTATVTDGALI